MKSTFAWSFTKFRAKTVPPVKGNWKRESLKGKQEFLDFSCTQEKWDSGKFRGDKYTNFWEKSM